jgi:polysaccharide deacetylase family protein (PEP-CTERM system associated)
MNRVPARLRPPDSRNPPIQPVRVLQASQTGPELPSSARQKTHVLTVALEDYFHVAPLQSVVQRDRWYRFELRLEASTRRTLDLLDECGARATFFVLGWVADAAPELVREVAARGHEIASKGYDHRDLRGLGRTAFQDDAIQAREALERATGRRVAGYRLAQGWLRPADLWILDALAESGYQYDSSLRVVLRAYADQPWRRFPHWVTVAGRSLLEVPLSSIPLCGVDLPIAGGNYFRQFPHALVKRAVAHWDRHYSAPYVMYFHTWELDPDQPRINGVPIRQKIRQYRNLGKMPAMVRHYLETYRFSSIAERFDLGTSRFEPATNGSSAPQPAVSALRLRSWAATPATAVAVVVPCFNEQESLPYLANTLRRLVRELGDRYRFSFVLVDDASTDRTWHTLRSLFGADPACTLVRHERNRGVAAAIRTGIHAASADVVCSIDCDCTYDPHELGGMIPLLVDGVDVVTASPYHPDGKVKNVPYWRLCLSKGLSRLYRVVLRQKLHTYTSCFRVYRRQAVLAVPVTRGGFFGVSEMLGRLDLAGRRIVEYPTTLEARVLGRSKMKVLRTIAGHLSLLAHLAGLRLGTARE